ncbi:MAG: DUF541 domain-containing protein [Planctomycetota bacterium]|jgi:uncharacterized protein YggE|nr:MAG: DUF541 domain-containing protein [Planctomycetota bacterium]
MSYWKHSLVVGLALLMATPSVFAQGKSGISVKATGLVKLRADVLEIDANVSGSSELAGDAITKYRNNRQRAVEAIEALQVPGLKVKSGRIDITSQPDAASQQARMRGMPVTPTANRPLNLAEPLSLRIDGIDKLTNDQILETLVKIVDAGKDAGIAIGGPDGQPVYNQFTGSYQSNGAAMVRFRLSDVEGARQQAFDEAMKNARRQGDRLAKLAGLKLGKVRAINETTPAQNNSPNQMNLLIAMMNAGAEKEAEQFSTNSLQEIPVTASLDVEFEVGE